MSEENFDSENEGEGIKSLRAAKAKADKELAEMRAQLAEFQREKRTSSVAEILKAKGVPASAANLYTGEEVSETAVSNWLNQYADVFNIQTGSNQNEAEVERQNGALDRGSERLFSPRTKDERVLGDPEEILAALNGLPYDELVKLGYMPKENI